METLEPNAHSFIVKVWLEETVDESGRAIWRGHITHVPTSKRQYFQDVDFVPTFIRQFIEQKGNRHEN